MDVVGRFTVGREPARTPYGMYHGLYILTTTTYHHHYPDNKTNRCARRWTS